MRRPGGIAPATFGNEGSGATPSARNAKVQGLPYIGTLSVGALLLCLRAVVVKPFVPGQVLLSMWTALLNQTSGLQGCCDVSCGILAGNDPGTGSGWQQSRPNRTPLCSDEIVSPNAAAAPLASSHGVSLHLFHFLFLVFRWPRFNPATQQGCLQGGRGKGILPGREGFQSMKAQQAQTVGEGSS